ncbi:MAG: MerR family transcriptional regulator [Cyanobacteria bacterium P01_H01_bin.15]
MVRHYHTLGLLPQLPHSKSNCRLYTRQDEQRLQHLYSLSLQGFWMSHIRQLLDGHTENTLNTILITRFQRRYLVLKCPTLKCSGTQPPVYESGSCHIIQNKYGRVARKIGMIDLGSSFP